MLFVIRNCLTNVSSPIPPYGACQFVSGILKRQARLHTNVLLNDLVIKVWQTVGKHTYGTCVQEPMLNDAICEYLKCVNR